MRRDTGRRCSLARALGSVGEFWTLLVVRDLWSYGPQKFDELQDGLAISSNTLANRLSRLTEQGVVVRRRYQQSPDRYEYCLTASGMDLVPALMMLSAWGEAHLADAAGPTVVFRHRRARHRARPTVVCAQCGEPLSLDNTHLTHGPGALPGARPYLDAADTVRAHQPEVIA